ncbi:hypothetical protein [Cryptosporangium arvum]|uniref:hypothetical protein n=1 Tax=Cryptosporangium arvum TaxID=80871 RepID=UPI0004B013DC|nr:hypothetical protein [Cryptosporangium arvum]
MTAAIAGAAANYRSAQLPAHADRYERGGEFEEVVTRLWEAWEPDAPIPRSPPGRPVLAQVGSSPAGMALGARWFSRT